MRLLKISIATMSVLIVIGVIALVYGLIQKTGGSATEAKNGDPPRPAMASAGRVKEGPSIQSLGLPAGTEIKQMTAGGGSLALYVQIPDKGRWIYILPLSGKGTVIKIPFSGANAKSGAK